MSVTRFDHFLPQTLAERLPAAIQTLMGQQAPPPIMHVVDEWDGPLPFEMSQDHIRLQRFAGGKADNAHKALLCFPKGTRIAYREVPHLRTLHLVKTFVLPNRNEYSFIYEDGKRGRYYRPPEGANWQPLDGNGLHQRLLELIHVRAVPAAADIAILDRCLLDLDLLAP